MFYFNQLLFFIFIIVVINLSFLSSIQKNFFRFFFKLELINKNILVKLDNI